MAWFDVYAAEQCVFALSEEKLATTEEVQHLSNFDTVSLNKKELGPAKGRVDHSRDLFGILQLSETYSNGFARAQPVAFALRSRKYIRDRTIGSEFRQQSERDPVYRLVQGKCHQLAYCSTHIESYRRTS